MTEKSIKRIKFITKAIVSIIIAITLFSLCSTKIERGHVGVIFDPFKNGVQDQLLTSGRKMKMPWQKVYQFPTVTNSIYMSADKREGSKENESITVKASDGTLNADLSFSYNFDTTDIVKVYKKYMGDGDYIVNNILRGQIRTWVSEATSKFTTMQIHQTHTEKVNDSITTHVAKKAKAYGVTIEKVALAETRASAEVEAAIKARQTAEQERKRQEDELKTLEIEKKKAELEAEKKLIIAEGERKANEVKAQGLDQRILTQMFIEAWEKGGSKVPQVISSDSLNKMINIK